MDKAAKLFLTELRTGTLGQISLETPEIVTVEMVDSETIRVEKATKKATKTRHGHQQTNEISYAR